MLPGHSSARWLSPGAFSSISKENSHFIWNKPALSKSWEKLRDWGKRAASREVRQPSQVFFFAKHNDIKSDEISFYGECPFNLFLPIVLYKKSSVVFDWKKKPSSVRIDFIWHWSPLLFQQWTGYYQETGRSISRQERNHGAICPLKDSREGKDSNFFKYRNAVTLQQMLAIPCRQ